MLPDRYRSTDDNVAHLLARTRKAGPLERAAEVAKLEEQVSQLSAAATFLEQSPQLANEAATTKAKLETTQAELNRRRKDMPTPASEHKALEEAMSALASAVEERKGRADRGKTKAAERVQSRKELFAELRRQLDRAGRPKSKRRIYYRLPAVRSQQ